LAGIASYFGDESDPLCPDDAELASVRAKLDAGLGDKIFQKFRALEVGGEDPPRARYTVIIVGALMMRAGAKISQDDLKHLRELVPTIASREGFALAFCDEGFRGPGKRQFLAALDNHQAGTPRDFLCQRSCFACGKTAKEIGSPILKCGGCEHAWFCDKVRFALAAPHPGPVATG
jgi:hypothetical protein